MVFEITKSCNLLCVCCNPCCVEVIVEEFEFVDIPLSVEVIVVLALCLIPLMRGGSCCALPLVQRLCLLESGVVYSCFVFTKFSVEVPCVGSPMWTYSGNPSV